MATDMVYIPVSSAVWSDDYKYEELYIRQTKQGQGEICCVPLLVYDLNLGDIISFDKNHILKKKIKDNGHYGFRIAAEHNQSDMDQYAEIIDELKKTSDSVSIEFNSHSLFGVDVPTEQQAQEIAAYLESLEENKKIIAYETIRQTV